MKGNRRVHLGCRQDEQAAIVEELRIRGSDRGASLPDCAHEEGDLTAHPHRSRRCRQRSAGRLARRAGRQHYPAQALWRSASVFRSAERTEHLCHQRVTHDETQRMRETRRRRRRGRAPRRNRQHSAPGIQTPQCASERDGSDNRGRAGRGEPMEREQVRRQQRTRQPDDSGGEAEGDGQQGRAA